MILLHNIGIFFLQPISIIPTNVIHMSTHIIRLAKTVISLGQMRHFTAVPPISILPLNTTTRKRLQMQLPRRMRAIPRLGQQPRHSRHIFRQTHAILYQPVLRRRQPGNQRSPRRLAHRMRAIIAAKQNTILCQTIQIAASVHPDVHCTPCNKPASDPRKKSKNSVAYYRSVFIFIDPRTYQYTTNTKISRYYIGPSHIPQKEHAMRQLITIFFTIILIAPDPCRSQTLG